MNIIKCTNCKKDKNPEEFSSYHGRLNKQCKKCREYYNDRWSKNTNDYTEKRKQYYLSNKENHHLRNFKNSILKKYGVSLEKYNEMLKGQNNQCKICGKEFVFERNKENLNKIPCVDHCHRTNKVRGLLCRMCNISLGHIESGLYDKAIKYLQVNEVQDKEPVI